VPGCEQLLLYAGDVLTDTASVRKCQLRDKDSILLIPRDSFYTLPKSLFVPDSQLKNPLPPFTTDPQCYKPRCIQYDTDFASLFLPLLHVPCTCYVPISTNSCFPTFFSNLTKAPDGSAGSKVFSYQNLEIVLKLSQEVQLHTTCHFQCVIELRNSNNDQLTETFEGSEVVSAAESQVSARTL